MSLRFKKFFVVLAGVTLLVGGAVTPIARAVNLTAAEAQASGVGVQNALDMVECGGKWDALSPSCIVPIVIYYGLYLPAMGLLTLSGYIFDFMIALSIDRDFIKQDFVITAWGIVRDFSNMIFIFILLYTGILTIFGMGKWQDTVTKVVVIALIINFSMFFTNVVIDAGNILAMGVYSGMGVEKTAAVDKTHKTGGVKERNLSATLVNAFAPQQFMELSSKNDRAFAATIFIIAAIVSGWVAWVFFKAAFLFMGRIIAFWFYIIISPYALVSMTLPKGKGNIYDSWLSGLLDQAFVAPIFLFFIYLIMKAVEGGTTAGAGIFKGFGNPSGSGFFFDIVFVPIVVTGMIIYALKYALGIAKSNSGKFGEIGANLGNQVLGIAGAVATGGASTALGGGAAALRATLGQNAQKVIDSRVLQQKATAGGFGGFVARQRLTLAEKTAAGSFDIRETGIAQKGIKAAGIDLGKVSKEAQGGWVGVQKKREKEDKARAKKFEVSDTEKSVKAGQINPEYKDAKARAEREYQEERAATLTHQEAQARASATPEGGAVKSAEGRVEKAKEAAKPRVSAAGDKVKASKDQRSGLKMEGDRLAKEIERLNKDQKEAEKNLQMGTAEELKEKIKQVEKSKNVMDKALRDAEASVDAAEKELQDTKSATDTEIKEEEQKLRDAQAALDATKEGAELKVAKDHLKLTADRLKDTQKIIKNTEEELTNWVQSENERRREQIGYVQTATRFYYTRGDREAVVRNIRDTKKKQSKEERAKEKKEKDLVKIFTEAAEKKEKEKGEGEEERPKEEGGEKKQT